jgi:hypothetical protein
LKTLFSRGMGVWVSQVKPELRNLC